MYRLYPLNTPPRFRRIYCSCTGAVFFSGQTIKDLTEDMSEIQYFMKYLGCYFGLTTPATS